ncbi:MAG: SapB/AmfS family lanthipeptide [Egibacteraceae bacterium]
MTLLDLQGMELADQGLELPASGGSGLTVLTCKSNKPSNLSVALCH